MDAGVKMWKAKDTRGRRLLGGPSYVEGRRPCLQRAAACDRARLRSHGTPHPRSLVQKPGLDCISGT